MIGQAAWTKSSLLLKNILQNTQTSKLFTKNIKKKVFTKVIKNVKLVAWVEEPRGLLRGGGKSKCL